MRQIHVVDGLTMRFPGRDGEFDEGVEVGLVAALMSLGQGEIRRRVAPASLDQLLAVAAEFNYRLGGRAEEGELIELTFLSPARRSRPTLVYSSAEAAG
jgi:hypothetical protein